MRSRLTTGSLKHLVKIAIDGPRRRSAFREQLFRLASKLTPIIAVDSRGIRYFLDTDDRDLSRAIFVDGHYEEPLMRAAVTAITRLRSDRGLQGRVFIDVGANVGTATLSAIREFGADGGLALEPHPGNFKLLQHNLLENDLLDRVVAFQVAASDQANTATLDVFPSRHGSHRIRREGQPTWDHFGSGAVHSIQVRSMTLDAAISNAGIAVGDIGLVWIDTEGHEASVLAGAERLLCTDTPVLIEFWPDALRVADGLDRLAGLVAKNYTHVLDLTGEDLRPASSIHALASEYGNKRSSPWTDLLLFKL